MNKDILAALGSGKKILAVGWDPGVGADKLAVIQPQGPVFALIPSEVGVGHTDMGMLSLGDLGRQRRHDLPAVVGWGTPRTVYLVGQNVDRYTRPVQRTDFGLYEGPERRALFYAGVHKALGPGRHTITVIVGMPIQIIQNTTAAKAALRSVRRWLLGQHQFTVDGDDMEVTVVSADLMAQPAGTVFAWGMDDRGIWVRDESDLDAPIAVCDVGFNTLDLFTLRGAAVLASSTGGDTAGIRRAAELLIERVGNAYNTPLTLRQADDLLRDRKPIVFCPESTYDVSEFRDQALDTAASSILQFIDRLWGAGRQFRWILFTGGGAELLRSRLADKYPGSVMDNAVRANALGLARCAQSQIEEAKEAIADKVRTATV